MIVASKNDRTRYQDAGVWGDLTIDRLLGERARAHPDQVAVMRLADPDSGRVTGASRSYAELDAMASALAGRLLDLGLGQDDVLAIQSDDLMEHAVAFFGALRAGLIVTLLDPLDGAADLEHVLRRLDVRAVISGSGVRTSATRLERLLIAASNAPSLRFLAAFSNAPLDGILTIDEETLTEAPADGGRGLPRPDCAADHVAFVSRQVRADSDIALARSHNQWLTQGLVAMAGGHITKESRILCPLAPTREAVYAASLAPSILAGATLIGASAIRPSNLVRAAVLHQATHVVVSDRIAGLPGFAHAIDAAAGARIITLMGEAAGDRTDAEPLMSAPHVRCRPLGAAAAVFETSEDPAGTLPYGPAETFGQDDKEIALVECSMRGMEEGPDGRPSGGLLRGELLVRGAAVATALDLKPGTPWYAGRVRGNWTPAGLRVEPDGSEETRFRIVGRLSDRRRVGGYELPISEIVRKIRGLDGVSKVTVGSARKKVLGPAPGLTVTVDEASQLTRDTIIAQLVGSGVSDLVEAMEIKVVAATGDTGSRPKRRVSDAA